jgi:uncharacterized protein YeaO (DUF488 family)
MTKRSSRGAVDEAAEPTLRIKRVYEPKTRGDGRRFLVERLWPRGVPKEALAGVTWLKDVAPSTALRIWFSHRVERWAEFRRRYREELQGEPDAWAPLVAAAKRGTVTLLYSARDRDHNAAVVLRDFLARRAGGRTAPDRRAPPARSAASVARHARSTRARRVDDAGDEREVALDRALADTFPASDPIASPVPSTLVR